MLTSTIGADHPSYGTSTSSMVISKELRSIPNAVSRYLPMIISYLSLVDSHTLNFYVKIFVALNSGRQKSTFTFFEVVNFPDWVSHIVSAVSFVISFDVILPVSTVELLPLFNIIRKFLNYALPLWVFMQPFRIGE